MDEGRPRTLSACAGCRERYARIAKLERRLAELERRLAELERRTTELERKLAEMTRDSQRQIVKFPHRGVDHATEDRARHGRSSLRIG
jgi:predicted RNase H-like nuclease (RuvC/YqgF family)